MSQELIEKRAQAYFEGENGCHDWDHTKRVQNLCRCIGLVEKANLDVLELAAVLHDIGRPTQAKSGICHAEIGSKMAKDLLIEMGYDGEFAEEVARCILTHRYRDDRVPQTLEAKILYDADKLDSIGAVGLGRAFLYAGEHGAKLHNDKKVDVASTEEHSKEDTAYREYIHKLKYIKDKLFTAEAKRLAQERHHFMELFFDKLQKEIDGEI